MRFREVAGATAKRLGMDAETVAFVVEGWFHVAGEVLADGDTVPTPIGTLKTRRADARIRRSRGFRRDVKITPRTEFRVKLNRINPDRSFVLPATRAERESVLSVGTTQRRPPFLAIRRTPRVGP
jgi:hypothetical protein